MSPALSQCCRAIHRLGVFDLEVKFDRLIADLVLANSSGDTHFTWVLEGLNSGLPERTKHAVRLRVPLVLVASSLGAVNAECQSIERSYSVFCDPRSKTQTKNAHWRKTLTLSH